MKPLRALIREYRHLALALLLVAFFIRAIIPAGFMVSTASDTVLSVTICSDPPAGLTPDAPGQGGGFLVHKVAVE